MIEQRKIWFSSKEVSELQTFLRQTPAIPSIYQKRNSTAEFEIRITPFSTSNTKPTPFDQQELRRIRFELEKISARIEDQEDQVSFYSVSEQEKQQGIQIRVIESTDDNGKLQVLRQLKLKPRGGIIDIPIVTKNATDEQNYTAWSFDPSFMQLRQLRFSKAVEIEATAEDLLHREQLSYKRRRVRTLYHLKDNRFQVHMTKVFAPNKNIPIDEIEIEVLPTAFRTIKDFMLAFKPLLYLFFPYVHIYASLSRFESEKLDQLPSYLRPRKRPVNIQQKHIHSNLLQYAITNKLDGIEYKLWFHPIQNDKTLLLLFNDVDIWVVQQLPFSVENELPLFMCEVVESEQGPQIHIFDTSSPLDPSVQAYRFDENGLLRQRLAKATQIVDFILQECQRRNITLECSLKVKTFFFPEGKSNDHLMKAIRDTILHMVQEFGLQNIDRLNDGLIFEPLDSSLLRETLKWKFPSKVSIDLRMVLSKYKPNIYELHTRNGFTFTYTSSTKKEYASYSSKMDYNQLIGEFTYDQGKWILHRIRWDKLLPNGAVVANETFDDMIYHKTLPWLLQQIQKIESFEDTSFVPRSEMFTSQANLIKAQLIQKWCKNKIVLDIGSGKGGDLKKFKDAGVKEIIFVEPNRDHLAELKSRMKSLPFTIPNRIIAAGGEHSEVISSAFQTKKADILTMMFSLTYFFSTPDLLDQLVQTISTSLSTNGVIIGTVMNGDAVQTFLDENDGYIKRSCYSIYPEAMVGNSTAIITTHIEGTQTAENITEALASIDQLAQKLDPYHITLTQSCPFTVSPPFFTDDRIIQKELIRMKVYTQLETELVRLYGPSIIRRLQLYILSSHMYQDPILVLQSHYDKEDILFSPCKQPDRPEDPDTCQTFESPAENGFLFLTKDTLQKAYAELQTIQEPDADLYLSEDGTISYNQTVVLSRQEASSVKGSTLLDKHRFALALRRKYFQHQFPYRIQFDKLGYNKTDNVLEAVALPETHFFTRYCSAFPDVQEGSLGRFQDLMHFPSNLIYILPIFDLDWLQMLIVHIQPLLAYYTFVIIIPVQDSLTRLIDNSFANEIWSRRSFSTGLVEVRSNKSIPHIEYILGIRRAVQQRKVITDEYSLSPDETRLFGLYNSFVFQCYTPLHHTEGSTLEDGPYLASINQDTTFLKAFLMSYLGSAYYDGVDIPFQSRLLQSYQFYEFCNGYLGLQIAFEYLQSPNINTECLPLLSNIKDTTAKSLQDWIGLCPSEEEKQKIIGFSYLLFDFYLQSPVKYISQLCADKLNIGILLINKINDTWDTRLIRGHRIDHVVFVYQTNDNKHQGMRVLGSSNGFISFDEAIQYPWYPFRSLPDTVTK